MRKRTSFEITKIKEDGEIYTIFKIAKKTYPLREKMIITLGAIKIKESIYYKYYIINGDYIKLDLIGI